MTLAPLPNGAAEPRPVEPDKEYVAGGTPFWSRLAMRAQILPLPNDDLTADFGSDIYDRMYLDPQVAACHNHVRASVIEEGLQLNIPEPVTADDADGHDLAVEIRDLCRSVLADLETPIDDVLWDLLASLRTGSRVAEEVYSEEQLARGRLILQALKVKPFGSTAFVVDPYMNVIGIHARTARDPLPGVLDLDGVPSNTLPRSKFLVHTFRPENGDPRGSSMYRPAYTGWWSKVQLWPEFLKYLARFASPSIYGTVGEKADLVNYEWPDGSITRRPAVVVLHEALLAFYNGTAAAFNYGTVLKVIEATGDGQAFLNGFNFCDKQIVTGFLHQTRATMEAQYGSRADSDTGADILETIIRQLKRSLCLAVYRDVLRPMVAYNYGDDAAAQLTPIPTLGTVERRDIPKHAIAMAALARAGMVYPSQLAHIYGAMLSMPAPKEGEEPIRTPAAPAAGATQPEPGEERPEDGDTPREENTV